ncbi:translation initiation factor eIF-2B subunit beta [Clonorchis sinensis]|uniref:Translation initiation factor eIF2B subunit beta n=1 Tax=Clonorchis sinensis TaxID=79923 RepID=G7YA13_CLOSI|nr:translation initiation factor eIF-2B subunit beta [Clonorchis sinensis]
MGSDKYIGHNRIESLDEILPHDISLTRLVLWQCEATEQQSLRQPNQIPYDSTSEMALGFTYTKGLPKALRQHTSAFNLLGANQPCYQVPSEGHVTSYYHQALCVLICIIVPSIIRYSYDKADRIQEHNPISLSNGWKKPGSSAIASQLAENSHVIDKKQLFDIIYRIPLNRSRLRTNMVAAKRSKCATNFSNIGTSITMTEMWLLPTGRKKQSPKRQRNNEDLINNANLLLGHKSDTMAERGTGTFTQHPESVLRKESVTGILYLSVAVVSSYSIRYRPSQVSMPIHYLRRTTIAQQYRSELAQQLYTANQCCGGIRPGPLNLYQNFKELATLLYYLVVLPKNPLVLQRNFQGVSIQLVLYSVGGSIQVFTHGSLVVILLFRLWNRPEEHHHTNCTSKPSHQKHDVCYGAVQKPKYGSAMMARHYHTQSPSPVTKNMTSVTGLSRNRITAVLLPRLNDRNETPCALNGPKNTLNACRSQFVTILWRIVTTITTLNDSSKVFMYAAVHGPKYGVAMTNRLFASGDTAYESVVKSDVLEAILGALDEFVVDINACYENISDLSLDLIHSDELILTHGSSQVAYRFLKRAAEKKRMYKVIVCEGYPDNLGHRFAEDLSKEGINVILVPDSHVFGLISRVNKVIIGCNAVYPDGTMDAPTGTYSVLLAAKHFSIPTYVCLPQYKLSPVPMKASANTPPPYTVLPTKDPSNASPDWIDSPAKILPPDDPIVSSNNLVNLPPANGPVVWVPRWEHIPAGLISLFLTNLGSHAPSYLYALGQELFHPSDIQAIVSTQ